MKIEEFIGVLKESKDFTRPTHISYYFKISEEDAFEILKQAEVFGIVSNVLDAQNWKEKQFILSPEKISGKAISEFQEFLDTTFPNSDKRLFQKWECSSCGTIITTDKEGKKPTRCSCRKGDLIKISEDKEEIKFDFKEIRPEKEITTLLELKEIITKHFPDSWFEFKACLSTYCTLVLKNLNGCPTLILVGMPSGEKTTDESFFYGYDLSYVSDEFSPRSFVSHSAAVRREELEDIDLLPKIKNKVLITPELAPLFEAPRDKLIESISILTRILDGEGYNKDTGAQGHRGYSGDYKFAWLGATTPLRNNFWNVAGKIGNRLFFLNMSDKNRNSEDYLKMFTTDKAYEEKVKICRGATNSFLKNFFNKHCVRSVDWDSKQDIFILKSIITYAELLAKLRGSLVAWKSSEERGEYEHTFPIIEEPPRAINALINFARGHALVNGRDFLNSEDLELVKRICMSSMPYDRHKFLQLILKHEGRLTTQVIEKELNCSQDTALRTMKVFKVLGVVDIKNISMGEGRPMHYVELKPEFQPLFNGTQVENNAINSKSQQPEPMRDEKITKNNQHTEGENSEIKDKSQENNPVRDKKQLSEQEDLDITYERPGDDQK